MVDPTYLFHQVYEHGFTIEESFVQTYEPSLKSLVVRAACGGVLMGMANLVPGISGGTMLLAVGIYTMFIGSIAELTTFKFRFPAIVTLGTVALFAALSILLGAGMIKDLVINHRWVMYSLFIGLTLGGVPLVWRLAEPVDKSFWFGTVGGFLVMLAMALGLGGGAGGEGISYSMLFFSGLAGAASMILPGISGGYLLLLLGQYETILGAVDQVKEGVKATDIQILLGAMNVVIPVGIGVLVGVIGVSNLIKWLLKKHEKPTLGALFGLLLGAVIGLWPFQRGRMPEVGEVLKGRTLDAEMIAAMKPEKWPMEYFKPTIAEALMAVMLVLIGLGLTLAIERLGRAKKAATNPS